MEMVGGKGRRLGAFGSVQMTGRDAWRIRIGEYRVIYEIHDGILVVVLKRGHHRQMYRGIRGFEDRVVCPLLWQPHLR